jgi:predicted enzyme related to lactoylglutathione lyase
VADEPTILRPNAITYIQIPAPDPDAAATFYEAVFGWTVRGRGTSHVSFDDASGYTSGAFLRDRAVSREPGILPYLYVAGIDDAIARLSAHGGEVVTAPYPEGDLWVATFRDPAGNVMGLWQMGPRKP